MKTRIFSILLLMLALSWPALRNRQPFMMSDTTTYVRGADAAIYKLTGFATMWTSTFINRYQPPADHNAPVIHAGPRDPSTLPVTIAGRSVFYGVLLYLSFLADGFWGAALLQMAVAATAITLAAETLCRAFGRPPPRWAETVLITAIVGICPAGYFAGYMMPDIFLPLAIIAFCQIAFLWRFMKHAERAFWIVLLLASMMFHNVHLIIIALIFAGLAIVKRAALWREDRKPALIILGTIVIALLAQTGIRLMVTHATGAAPVDIPFVTARIIADGPGRDYLAAHCPQSRFRLCDYVGRLQDDSDIFLWSYDPRVGVFSAVPPQDRRRIASEQTAFVIAVARDRPLALARSTMISILRQSAKWGLDEFNYYRPLRDNLDTKLPLPVLQDIRRSAAYERLMPVRLVEIMTPLLALAAFPLFFITFRRTASPDLHRAMSCYLAIIFGAIIVNNILCGGVSTPHDRYQMRLIWLLPLFAGMLWIASSAYLQARRE